MQLNNTFQDDILAAIFSVPMKTYATYTQSERTLMSVSKEPHSISVSMLRDILRFLHGFFTLAASNKVKCISSDVLATANMARHGNDGISYRVLAAAAAVVNV